MEPPLPMMPLIQIILVGLSTSIRIRMLKMSTISVVRSDSWSEHASVLLRAADRYGYRLWKHYFFCRDCLWGERTSIYSWYLTCFACDALSRLTGDAPSLH